MTVKETKVQITDNTRQTLSRTSISDVNMSNTSVNTSVHNTHIIMIMLIIIIIVIIIIIITVGVTSPIHAARNALICVGVKQNCFQSISEVK